MFTIIPKLVRFSLSIAIYRFLLLNTVLLCCLGIACGAGLPSHAVASPLQKTVSPSEPLSLADSTSPSEFIHTVIDRFTGSRLSLPANGRSAASPVEPLDARYTHRRPRSDGIGKIYMGREIADVMGHRGAAWLERPSRKQEEKPWKIIDTLELNPADRVVDLGAGTGYMTFQLAAAVPEGTVFAVDIQPEMLDMLSFFQKEQGVDNVQSVLAQPTDPQVPNGIDVVLMVDAYHELAYPYEVMMSIVDALNPGGRVVLAEYRGENPLIPIKRLHKMTERQVRRELEAVGLEWVKTEEQLPRQHLIFFQKPVHSSAVR